MALKGRLNKIRQLLNEEEEAMEKKLKAAPKDKEEVKEEEEDLMLRKEEEDEEEEEEEEEDGEKKEEEADPEKEDSEEDSEEDKDDEEEMKEEEEEEDGEKEPEQEKEFDVNDDSDVFLDDEEEDAAKEKKEEEDKEMLVEPKDKEEVKEEEEEEEEEGEKEDVEECDKPMKDKEEVKEEEEEEEEEDAPKKPSMDVEEHVNALINGEDLSEDFKNKIKTIFEGAVKVKVLEYARSLKHRYNKKLTNAKKSIHERLLSKMDGFADCVVEEFMEENKLAIEHGLRTEITEEFISDLRNLFETHNIMIPRGKENLVESLTSKVDALKKDLDEEIKKNVSLRKKLNEQKKMEVLREVCEGLADTQIEKLKSLASNIGYDESYRDKLLVIKENYFSQKPKKQSSVEELAEPTKDEMEAKPASPAMKQYVTAISKSKFN